MKKFKKLIPALCMLLVSAVMLGSTTFAWFSMNKTVTATGMEIKAEVPTQLLISADNSVWGNTMRFESEKTLNTKGVAPVTAKSLLPNGILVPTFYRLTVNGMKLVNETGKLTGITGTLGETYDYAADTDNFETTEEDVFIDTFHLKLAGKLQTTTDAGKVSAKAKISSQKAEATSLDEITKALHIVITDNAGKVIINQDCGALGETLTIEAGTSKELNLGNVHTFVADNESKDFVIYVFYDGNDMDCTNAKALSIEGLSISLEFTLGA